MVLCFFETTIVLFDNFHVLHGESHVGWDILFDESHIDDFELFGE